MKEERGNREFSGAGGAFTAIVRSCKCVTCKNYFWIPSAGRLGDTDPMPPHLLPKFCVFCGRKFDEKEIEPMDAEDVSDMEQLLGAQPEDY